MRRKNKTFSVLDIVKLQKQRLCLKFAHRCTLIRKMYSKFEAQEVHGLEDRTW